MFGEISSVYLAAFAMTEAAVPSVVATCNKIDLDQTSLKLQMTEFAFGGFYSLSTFLLQIKRSSDEIISLSNLVDPIASMALLFLATNFIQLLDLVNGFGAPDKGCDFHNGAATFTDDISTLVAGAVPDDGWTGAAAETYRIKNQNHLKHLTDIGGADGQIADTAKSQAAAVELGHELLASASLILNMAVMLLTPFYASWYFLNTRTGPTGTGDEVETILQSKSKLGRSIVNFARAAVLAAGLMALGAIGYLIREGNRSRKAINDAKDTYNSVASYWLTAGVV